MPNSKLFTELLNKEISKHVEGIRGVYSRFPVEELAKIIHVLIKAYEDDKYIITMGNGGHGLTASHWVQDF